MGILIRQNNSGKQWIVELKEKWCYVDKTVFDKARDYLDSMAIPYFVDFAFEVFLIEFTQPKSRIVINDFKEAQKIIARLVIEKEIGVGPMSEAKIK